MSVESAKAFFERLKTDKDFAKQVKECKDAEARGAFVKSAGYDFTQDEIKKAGAELSDEELDAVSGGWDPMLPGVCCPNDFYRIFVA